MLLDIDLWQMITDAFHQVNWMDLWDGFIGFLSDTFHRYPIPSLITIIVIAMFLLYRLSRAVEKRSIANARRAKNRRRVQDSRSRRGQHRNHDHDRRNQDDDEGDPRHGHPKRHRSASHDSRDN